ncbi:S9 family peptidase [soil metagenome]
MTTRSTALSCERLAGCRRLADPQQSPDGRRIVFAVTDGFTTPGTAPAPRLWLIGPDGRAAPLDASGAAVLPRWAPDGSAIAFASRHERSGGMGLGLVDPAGDDLRAAGDIRGFIEDIQWAPTGDALLVLTVDDPPGDGDSDPRVRRHCDLRDPWRRLHRVELATGVTTEVGPEGFTVWEFDWNGEEVAAVLSEDPSENGWYRAFLGRVDPTTRRTTRLYAPRWQIARPSLSAVGGRIAFLEGICSDRGSLVGEVMVIDAATHQPRTVTSQLDATWIAWRDDDAALWFTARDGLMATCGVLAPDGGVEHLWRGEGAFGPSPRLSSDCDQRQIVTIRETLNDPPEVAALDVVHPERGWRRLTSVNDDLAHLPLPPAERIAWQADDGLEIEALLVRPPGADEEPLPLVVFIHGGPSAAWGYAFPSGFRHAALLADAGYAVLMPNPRGSTGRGQPFAQAVVGDLGGAELRDTLAGIELCVSQGIADGGRVGIIGASHGGFMAAWAVTQTTRFRASVALACVSDYLSAHYTASIPALDDILFDGAEPFPAYLERSPIAYARACTTPTLILHGELDPYCPVSQAEELYGALVQAGVETELVVYPREGHGWMEFDHQVDVWQRVRDWFDRHLAATG